MISVDYFTRRATRKVKEGDDFSAMPNYIWRLVRFVRKGKNFLEACLHGGWTCTSQFSLPPSRHCSHRATIIFPWVCADHHAFANSFFSAFSTSCNETTKSLTLVIRSWLKTKRDAIARSCKYVSYLFLCTKNSSENNSQNNSSSWILFLLKESGFFKIHRKRRAGLANSVDIIGKIFIN